VRNATRDVDQISVGVSESETADREVVKFRVDFESRSPLDELIREGARRMLQAAIDAEVDDFLTEHSGRCDDQGRRLLFVTDRCLSERFDGSRQTSGASATSP
jgi:hypothetical protein